VLRFSPRFACDGAAAWRTRVWVGSSPFSLRLWPPFHPLLSPSPHPSPPVPVLSSLLPALFLPATPPILKFLPCKAVECYMPLFVERLRREARREERPVMRLNLLCRGRRAFLQHGR